MSIIIPDCSESVLPLLGQHRRERCSSWTPTLFHTHLHTLYQSLAELLGLQIETLHTAAGHVSRLLAWRKPCKYIRHFSSTSCFRDCVNWQINAAQQHSLKSIASKFIALKYSNLPISTLPLLLSSMSSWEHTIKQVVKKRAV